MILLILAVHLVSCCGLLATAVFGSRTGTSPNFFTLHFVAALASLFLALLAHILTLYYFWGTRQWIRRAGDEAVAALAYPDLRRIRRSGILLTGLTAGVMFLAVFTGSRKHLHPAEGSWHPWAGWATLAIALCCFLWLLRCLARYNALLLQLSKGHRK